MRPSIALGGHATRWVFRDSGSVDRWLADRPWLESAQSPLVIRVPDEGCMDIAVDSLRRTAAGHDRGMADLDVVDLGTPAPGGLENAVGRELEVVAETRLTRLRGIATSLRMRPRLFVARVNAEPPALYDEVTAFLDILPKVEESATAGAPLAVVLLDTPSRPLPAEGRDFTVGFPEGSPLGIGQGHAGNRWYAYVASRLAWESGGDLSRARQIEAQRSGVVPLEMDDQLEERLNQGARALQRESADGAFEALLSWTQTSCSNANRSRTAAEAGPPVALRRERLVWRPGADEGWRPVPWAARALLLGEKSKGAVHSVLRSCLVDSRLAQDIMRRVLYVEAVLVARVRNLSAVPKAPSELAKRWRECDGTSEWPLPPGCPASPADEWEVSTIGELTMVSQERSDGPRHKLRNLRNAIAHGTYPSWSMVKAVLECEDLLGIAAEGSR